MGRWNELDSSYNPRPVPHRRVGEDMTTILCPTDCAIHDYYFPHTLIRTTRIIDREIVIAEMIVCRECKHWIDNRAVVCNCRFRCHEEEGGTLVQSALS